MCNRGSEVCFSKGAAEPRGFDLVAGGLAQQEHGPAATDSRAPEGLPAAERPAAVRVACGEGRAWAEVTLGEQLPQVRQEGVMCGLEHCMKALGMENGVGARWHPFAQKHAAEEAGTATVSCAQVSPCSSERHDGLSHEVL